MKFLKFNSKSSDKLFKWIIDNEKFLDEPDDTKKLKGDYDQFRQTVKLMKSNLAILDELAASKEKVNER